MTFTAAFWDDRKTHIIHVDQTRILQFNTWEVRAKSFSSTCSKEPFITQTYELHPVSHPIWNPVIKPSQVEIIISTAELKKGTLFRWKKKWKIWLIAQEKTDIYREKETQIATHSRKRVMYWRLHRDQLGGDVPYRSWGDMTNGLFPIGSQLLLLPSCSIPKLKHRVEDDNMTGHWLKAMLYYMIPGTFS